MYVLFKFLRVYKTKKREIWEGRHFLNGIFWHVKKTFLKFWYDRFFSNGNVLYRQMIWMPPADSRFFESMRKNLPKKSKNNFTDARVQCASKKIAWKRKQSELKHVHFIQLVWNFATLEKFNFLQKKKNKKFKKLVVYATMTLILFYGEKKSIFSVWKEERQTEIVGKA